MFFLILALALGVTYVAWQNAWDAKATMAALGAYAVAAWEFISSGFSGIFG